MKQIFNYNISKKLGSTLSVSEIEPGMQVEYNDQTFTILQVFQPNDIETTKGTINIPSERTVKLIGIVRIKQGAKLSARELRIGMIVYDGNIQRYVTDVTAGKVSLTGKPPIYRTNDSIFRFAGWYVGALKKINKGAVFFLDGHFYIKGAYKKSLKSYLCTLKDSGETIYINEQITVTI